MVQADPAADTDVQPLKADPTTWTPWTPAAAGNTVGDRVGAGAVFNSRARWTMGWQPRVATDGSGQLLDAPYYMPTFNHSRTDHKTAAAGDGRDWNWSGEEADTSASPNGTNAGADATGVTHPGDGTDGYWNAGDTATSLLGTPPDTQSGTHTACQTVVQDQPVMCSVSGMHSPSQAVSATSGWSTPKRAGPTGPTCSFQVKPHPSSWTKRPL